MRFSRKQAESIGHSTGRVNIWEGSIRSGKTFASILRWLGFVATAPQAGELVMVGKNLDSIYRNLFAPIENEPALSAFHPHVRYKQGATTAHVLGRRVNVIGANDAKAEAKIRGMTVAGAYVDELTVLPVEFFKQLLGRMSVPGAQLFATTNPDHPAHWLKTDYIDRIGDFPDWRRFHFTLDDNPALPPEYVDSLKREYTGLWYRRFILGLWVSAEGAIYDMWDPDRHVIRWEDLPLMRSLYAVGVDHGTTNPSAGILLGMSMERHLYLVDEWRHDPGKGSDPTQGQRLTVGQQSALFREWYDSPHLPQATDMRPRFVVVDPAAAAFRVQLFHDGLKNVRPADNEVNTGIARVATLLTEGDLLVTDRCSGFISEVSGYSWDSKAAEKGEDRPVKVADHSLDAARYAIASTETLWRPQLRRKGRILPAA